MRVGILGGGVAGLSAAHELIERGYDVTVYEAKPVFGGKARSMLAPGSGTGGRADLPAEHGFRFFPSFYRHVIDTMSRIPSGHTKASDHLVEATRMMLARANHQPEIIGPTSAPTNLDDLRVTVKFAWDYGVGLGIPPQEMAIYLERLLALLCSCEERRLDEIEKQSWWDFITADQRSPAFQKYLADGMTRALVAAQAHQMSARTGGLVSIRLLRSLARAGHSVDRVLDGPTSEVWIEPWVTHLTTKGVDFRVDHVVAGIHCDTTHITGVTVQGPTGYERVEADYYVAALPVERFRTLLSPEMRAADPHLNGLDHLKVAWMNGAMFYLRDDEPIVDGHVIFIDSEWSLTAISQRQFWKTDLRSRGDGNVGGILSVDISEWHRPGKLTGKVAMECSREEIRREVWAQMQAAIDDGSLDEDNVADWFLDPDIVFPNPSFSNNMEPLLINTKGSWQHRPDAATKIPNLFLASDYVRTYTDLATMEAANEAAKETEQAPIR